MRGSLILSVVLHILVILLLMIGMPFLRPDEIDPIDSAVVVDMVQRAERPVAISASPKASPLPKDPPKPAMEVPATKPQPAKPEPQKSIPPRTDSKLQPSRSPPPEKQAPPLPAKTEKTPQPEKPPPAPGAEKKPAPEHASTDEKTPQTEKPAQPAPAIRPLVKPARRPKRRPEPPKPRETELVKAADGREPSKKPAAGDDPFRDLVRSVERFRHSSSAPPPGKGLADPVRQQASAGSRASDAPAATASELDAIRAQIERNWLIDGGALGIEDMEIRLRLKIRPDGSVYNVTLEPESVARYRRDPAYRAMADRAIRAAYKASPLQYPKNKFKTFEIMTLSFRPSARL